MKFFWDRQTESKNSLKNIYQVQVAASRDIGEQIVSENYLLVIVKRKHHSPFQKKFEVSINMNVEVAIVSTKGFDINYQIVKIVSQEMWS